MKRDDFTRAPSTPQSEHLQPVRDWKPATLPRLYNTRRWHFANAIVNVLFWTVVCSLLWCGGLLVVKLMAKALAVLAMAPAGYLRRGVKRKTAELEPVAKRAKPEPLLCVCGARMSWRAKRGWWCSVCDAGPFAPKGQRGEAVTLIVVLVFAAAATLIGLTLKEIAPRPAPAVSMAVRASLTDDADRHWTIYQREQI